MGEPHIEASEGKGTRTVTRKWEDKEGKHIMVEQTDKTTDEKSIQVDGKPVEDKKEVPKPATVNLNDTDRLKLRVAIEQRDILLKILNGINEINYRMDQQNPLTADQNKKLGAEAL